MKMEDLNRKVIPTNKNKRCNSKGEKEQKEKSPTESLQHKMNFRMNCRMLRTVRIRDLPEDASTVKLPHEASVSNNKMNDEEKEKEGDGQ